MSGLSSVSILHGRPVIEEPLSRTRSPIDRKALALAIMTAGESDGVVGDTIAREREPNLDQVRADWIAKGWSRSLEYFEWSTDEFCEYDLSPAPLGASSMDLWTALLNRRTHRVFDPTPISRDVMVEVLEASMGIHHSGLELWLVAYSIDGLSSGVWRTPARAPRLVAEGDQRLRMSQLMCGMTAPLSAAATVVITCAISERQRRFRHERALRELYVEVGMIGQRLIVSGELRGLGCLVTPATNDHELSALLGLDESTVPVYSVTFGRKPMRGHGDSEP